MKTYLNTVTYGTSAFPFLAVRPMHYIAEAIQTYFYVNYFLGGAETIEELIKLKYQVIEILKMDCF